MPTASINSSGRGSIKSGNLAGWSTARSASTGTVQTTTVSNQIDVGMRTSIARAGNQYDLGRTYYWFDTSAYAGTITAIDLNFFTGNNNGIGDIIVCESFAFANGTTSFPVATDFQIFVKWDPGNTLSNPVPFSGNTGMSFALNSNAVTLANAGKLNLIIVEYDHDWNDVSPVNNSYWGSVYVGSNASITVTYTASGWGYDINDVTNSTITSINGTAKTSITKVNDV